MKGLKTAPSNKLPSSSLFGKELSHGTPDGSHDSKNTYRRAINFDPECSMCGAAFFSCLAKAHCRRAQEVSDLCQGERLPILNLCF